MRVLFVTSEVATLFKLGGLADVSRSLPLALDRLGVHVTVVLPYYTDATVDKSHCIGTLSVDWAGKREIVFIFSTKLSDSKVPVLLVRHPKLDTYHSTDIVHTFAFFSLAVTRLVEHASYFFGHPYDIVHCQDWHTALVSLLLGENNKTTRTKQTLNARSSKTIITIHNLLYQGETGDDVVKLLGVPRSLFHALPRKHGEAVNILREGIEYSDIVSTVSPTYAKEIMTPEYGEGLVDVFSRRKDSITGILNGIEVHQWNPDTDKALAVHYTNTTVTPAKKKLKTHLQKELGLREEPVPLFAFVGRLELRQKGIDIMVGAVHKLLKTREFQLVVLGTGNGEAAKEIKLLVDTYPRLVAFSNEFDDHLARRIYASSDVLLVPSRFEPCGLTQMIAMRYGTIPLVRYTGGLADSVKDGVTGFVFKDYTARALEEMLKIALDLYATNSDKWNRIVARCMNEDFSWDRSGKKYVTLYKKLLG